MGAAVGLWGRIGAAFGVASGLQVLMYARPLWEGAPVWMRLPEQLYTPTVLVFFFGPSLAAAAWALLLLYRHHGSQGEPPPLAGVLLIVALAVLSSYLGVFVSFNTWGT